MSVKKPFPPARARRATASLAMALALGAGLTACSSPEGDQPMGASQATTEAAATTQGSAAADAAGMQILDPWAAARPDPSQMPMTAVFATVRNTSNNDISLVSASTNASSRAELHSTVMQNGQPVMQRTDKLTIPAGGTLLLQPGGDHVMVLDLANPVQPGAVVHVTLNTEQGQSISFDAVAKQFTGAQEPYHQSDGSGQSPASS
ncbi:copper chaperone PCu(A)C [Piscicoccus intestinalis]|uniref:copper chaperone PCu(A)C n=1 Tax=Piscicoccus intestinalis TaxID=746033 RepID=UPI0012ED636F|nr:copper chaperone PCu(A)C [Piscicoccus intestinalis]